MSQDSIETLKEQILGRMGKCSFVGCPECIENARLLDELLEVSDDKAYWDGVESERYEADV